MNYEDNYYNVKRIPVIIIVDLMENFYLSLTQALCNTFM